MNCCCTGHRPKGFPFGYKKDKQKYNAYLQALRQATESAITEQGVTRFLCGMALGVDMDFADIVLQLRERYPIALECVIPCAEQTAKWKDSDKARYHAILQRADTVTYTGESYTRECMLKRNRYMVDNSDLVIAVFNGIRRGGTWYTIQYAKEKQVPIVVIDLNNVVGDA